MTDITVPSVRGLVTLRAASEGIESSLTRGLAVFNFPSEGISSSQIRITSTNRVNGPMETSFVTSLAVSRGRVYNPKLRAWTYTLDGHDYYILRLGDDTTFVYDITTQQWSRFTSQEYEFWRPNVGSNWTDAMSLANEYGSNVVVGDDTYGVLWFLNPDQGYDDDVNQAIETPKRFPRVATGQIPAKNREYLPIYEVFLTGSNGWPALSASSVELKYSDDAGNTYVSAGSVEVEDDNYNQDITWKSLGRFSYPGRLFRIEDDGALARIDGLDVNHGATAS